MVNSTPGFDSTEKLRIHYAFWLSLIGLGFAAGLAILLVSRAEMKVRRSDEVVAIVGLFTSVTGTLVGAFFGLQIGAAGVEQERRSRHKAEEAREHAEGVTRLVLAHLHPDMAREIAPALHERQGVQENPNEGRGL